jgi:hypothetical protein
MWTNSTDAYLAAASITPTGDPTTYEYAMKSPEAALWRQAMIEEIESVEKWDLGAS